MKKQKTGRSFPRFSRLRRVLHKRPVFISGITVIGVLAVVQLGFDVVVYHTYLNPSSDQTVVTQLIIGAIEGINKPANVDPVSGAVYLTDARLRLPAPTDPYMQLIYLNVGGQAPTAELQVTTTNILRHAEMKLWASQANNTSSGSDEKALFEQVPNLQSCNRGVQMFFQAQPEPNSPQWQSKGSKLLSDGKTIYYYTEPTCQADQSQLLTYLKQIDSY